MTKEQIAALEADPATWGISERYLKDYQERTMKSVWTAATRVGGNISSPIFYMVARSENTNKASQLLIQAHIALLEAHRLLANEFHGNDGISPKEKRRIAEADAYVAGQMGVVG
jgi:hypothetical protein